MSRRRIWDDKILAFVKSHDKPLVWLGDLNVSHRDIDVSDPAFFRKQKGDNAPLPADPDYRGQPGFAKIEQTRFSTILSEGGLVDAYRYDREIPYVANMMVTNQPPS